MRILLILCLLPATALAQVTTNDQALDSLKSPAPASAPAAAPETAKQPSARRTSHRAATSTHAPAKLGPPPSIPAGPPPNPVFVPPAPVLPVHPKPLPPPVPIKADALGGSSQIPGGMRLTFGPGSSDLNTENDQTLLDIAKKAQADPALSVTITAWAPGTNEDPSTPRRLSLDRALAARAVLINAGVPSERIYAVARGFLGIEGAPPDRVDIVMAYPKKTPEGTPTLPPPAANATTTAGAKAERAKATAPP